MGPFGPNGKFLRNLINTEQFRIVSKNTKHKHLIKLSNRNNVVNAYDSSQSDFYP